MSRRTLVIALALLASACGQDGGNPFAASSPSRPPSPSASILFVSGSWTNEVGRPRELVAVTADGSGFEQLTNCARAAQPCDILQAAPSPDRNRVVAVRTTPDAEAGAQVLFFMDLARSVESVLFARRRIEFADWSHDGSFLLYSSITGQTGNEDMFTAGPDGTNEQNLTDSLNVRERSGRIDPSGRTAAFERIDVDGVSHVYLFRETPITSGPATGPALPGTPYVMGSDANPTFSPDATSLVFRRLTGIGNGGLGTWDLMVVALTAGATPRTLVTGPLFRGAPDWGPGGILYVETDATSNLSQLVKILPDGSGRTVLRTEDSGFRMGSPRWLP
jgi:Tol biopolymer transport system component